MVYDVELISSRFFAK